MNKVDFTNLPRDRNGRILWGDSVGQSFYFECEGIEGKMTILGKDGKKIKLQYENNVDSITFTSLYKGNFRKLLKIRTNEFKFEISNNITDGERDITILNKEYRVIKGIKRKYYQYQCNIDSNIDWIEESCLISGSGCNVCGHNKVLEGYNDIPTTNPKAVKYFVGGYEEAKLYTAFSDKKIKPICPNCGKIKNKAIQVKVICRSGVSCECSDNTSYPEKFIFNILEQLNDNFITQLNKNTFQWCEDYRYDFYSIKNNLIIETHGGQHYSNVRWNNYNVSNQQQIDDTKMKIALSNNVSKYITLDCRISDKEYIKEQILNSELINYYNFNDINWDDADEFACSNLIKETCEFYENHKELQLKEISDKLGIALTTLHRRLKKGKEFGWCSYNPQDKSKKKIQVSNDSDIYVFDSVMECSRTLECMLDTKYPPTSITRHIHDGKRYKGYYFKEVIE